MDNNPAIIFVIVLSHLLKGKSFGHCCLCHRAQIIMQKTKKGDKNGSIQKTHKIFRLVLSIEVKKHTT